MSSIKVIISGVDAETIAPKSDPVGKVNDPMYCPGKPGLDVSNANRPGAAAADATLKAV